MEKRYFRMLLLALFAVLCGSMNAQKPFFGITSTGGVSWSAGNGEKGCIISLDMSQTKKGLSSTSYVVQDVPFKVEAEDLFVKAGTSAGTAYFALMGKADDTTAKALYSLNCATGEQISLGSIAASDIVDMTYDAANDKLYGVSFTEGDEDDASDSETKIYTIDYKTATSTEALSITGHAFRAIAFKDGKLYGLEKLTRYNEDGSRTDWWNYDVRIYTIDVTSGELTAIIDKDFTVNNPNYYTTMEFDGDKLYYCSSRIIYTIDLEAKTISNNGKASCPKDVSGMTFTASTTNLPETSATPDTPESNLIYGGIVATGYVDWEAGNGEKGCIIGVDPSDLATVVEVPVKIEEEELFQTAGTAAGTAYYAIMYNSNEESSTLYSLNFTDGKETKIGSVSGGSSILDMAFDATNGKLYALQNGYGDDGYESYIYEINPTNGEKSLTATLAGHQFKAMAYDAEGKLNVLESTQVSGDWWHQTLGIYTVDLTSGDITAVSDNEMKVSNLNDANSMEFHDGKLYLLATSTLYTIDLETKTATASETKFPKTMSGITFTKSSTDAADNLNPSTPDPDPETPETDPSYLEAVEERYGSSMGDADGVTQKTLYFYDKNYNLVRKASYGRNYKSNDSAEDEAEEWTLSYYYTYDYNDKGQLELTYKRQYGLYDGDDYGFSTANDSTKYEYNEDGTLAKMSDSAFETSYTYDEEGNLTVADKRYKSSGKSFQKLTYSDFGAKNCPAHIKSESEQSGDATNLVYEADCTYNDQGKLTKQLNYTITETTDETTGAPIETKRYIYSETNTYDEAGILRSTVHYSNPFAEGDTFIATDSVSYTPDANDSSIIREDSYTWDDWNGEWSGLPTYIVHRYKNFDSTTATEVAVEEVADKINCNKVTVSFPTQDILLGNYAFDLYRDGQCIKRLGFTDEDVTVTEEGTVVYVDNDLKNAEHDYFVQSVLLDELGADNDSLNVSNVAKITNNVTLPAPQNVRGKEKNKGEDGNNYVTVVWDAPEYTDHSAEELGFQRYNVMLGNRARTADNSTADGQALEWEVNYYTWYTEQIVSVQAVYKYGKATSEKVTIKLEDVQTGINQLKNNNTAAYSNAVLTLAAPANIAVFNAAGQNVAKANASSSISLNNLPKGAYIITIEQNGKVNALKVTR